MDVVRGVVAESGEIGFLEQCGEGLRPDGSLAPGAASEDFEVAKASALGRAHRRAIFREIFGRQEAPLLLHEGDDLAGDVAAIKGVAGRFETRLPAAPRKAAARSSSAMYCNDAARSVCRETAAFRWPPVRQKNGRGRRPGAVVRLVPLEAGGHQRVHRKDGGPAAAVNPRWPSAFDYSMALSGAGYFVLYPNPRGSFGMGENFTKANVKDFGYGDFRDIMAGVDEALKTAPIDQIDLGLLGGVTAGT